MLSGDSERQREDGQQREKWNPGEETKAWAPTTQQEQQRGGSGERGSARGNDGEATMPEEKGGAYGIGNSEGNTTGQPGQSKKDGSGGATKTGGVDEPQRRRGTTVAERQRGERGSKEDGD